jgi:hypothetical protein
MVELDGLDFQRKGLIIILNEGRFLFKYRNFLYPGEKDHTRILSDNELFFPSPSKLNDPFDSNLRFRYDDFTADEFIKYWADRLPQLSWAEATKKARESYEKISHAGR